jgi:hypothetical protein
MHRGRDKPCVEEERERERERERESKTEELLSQKSFQAWKISSVGNFIKPKQSNHFIGAEPEATPCEKPKKGWRGHNDCRRHWRGIAWLISWCPVSILWWTMHSRPWSRVGILEIIMHHSHDIDTRPVYRGNIFIRNAATQIWQLRTSQILNT